MKVKLFNMTYSSNLAILSHLRFLPHTAAHFDLLTLIRLYNLSSLPCPHTCFMFLFFPSHSIILYVLQFPWDPTLFHLSLSKLLGAPFCVPIIFYNPFCVIDIAPVFTLHIRSIGVFLIHLCPCCLVHCLWSWCSTHDVHWDLKRVMHVCCGLRLCLRGMVEFHQVAFDGKNILFRVAGRSQSIEAVSVIIIYSIMNTPFRQERRGRKYNGR